MVLANLIPVKSHQMKIEIVPLLGNRCT